MKRRRNCSRAGNFNRGKAAKAARWASTFARNWRLGRAALAKKILPEAKRHFEFALTSPRNLGEAKHLLANQSDIHYWLGCALAGLGDKKSAREHWLAAANFKGDFQEMSVRAFSEMTYYSALSWEKLGQRARAKKLFRELLAYAQNLQKTAGED